MGKVNKNEIVALLREELQQRLVEVDAIKRVIELLELLDGSEQHEKPVQQKKTKKKVKATVPKKKTTRKQGKSDSKYKGVIVSKRADGTSRFRANCWNAKEKKTKYLGAFDSELEAAAAVERALGNEREADRLFPLGVSSSKTPIKSIETYFRCKHCDLETKTKPVQCMQCNSASFDGPLKREIGG